jgi:hypothetical protein
MDYSGFLDKLKTAALGAARSSTGANRANGEFFLCFLCSLLLKKARIFF